MDNKKLLDRFYKYIKEDTTSDPECSNVPSTATQLIFAKKLAEELKDIGLKDISIDDKGYVMATLPSNLPDDKKTPVIGFIAHMDTSPDISGKNINPQITKNYDGNDIELNKEQNIILSSKDFPELKYYIGQDIITTDGTTLLGADDKAGLAEIVTALEYLVEHPEIKHGTVRVGFTPDEEIGRGADYFDVKKFNADWAYTIDGGQIGELEYENFNAAGVKIEIKGRNVHPGTAKDKMINSLIVANKLISMLPESQKPEHTEKYEGFFHLTDMQGTVEEASLSLIIRDHDIDKFEDKKKILINAVEYVNLLYSDCVKISINDQYFNMKAQIEPVKHIVDIAFAAMEECGVTPIVKPIRGGTDGARLSYMGLPCPNIFGGGHNFHGRYEFVPIQSMEKAVEVILKIIEIVSK